MTLPEAHPTDDRPESGPTRDFEARERRFLALAAATFGGIALLIGADLASDLARGATFAHALLEATGAGLGLAGMIVVVRRLAAARKAARTERARADALDRRLAGARADAEHWRAEAAELLRGLGDAIDKQFGRWDLTPAERDVALLLLKGLAHKEIANVRGVGEATVRQQAQAVYRKAGVEGRHDLAAFFLEDLLLPSDHEIIN